VKAQTSKKARRRGASADTLPDLPHAPEAERVITGAVLLANSNIDSVFAKLAAEDFFDSRLSTIYSRLRDMRGQGKNVDLPTAVDELRAHGELEHSGGPAFVASLVDGLPHRLALDSYMSAILEKAMLRRIAYMGQEISVSAVNGKSARDILLAAGRKLSGLQATFRLRDKSHGSETGAEILGKTAGFLLRFVAMSNAQASAIALWTLHTHALDASEVTGYLSITSAEPRCGKTRLLELLELLVAEPWLTGRVTPAVLVRKIDGVRPTLLLDESDTALRDDSEYGDTLRGVLNLGYRRGGVVSCCVGQAEALDFHDFSAFCPKAIAGIGSLPDTVADRSFPIRLQRRAPHEPVETLRRSEVQPEAASLRDQIAGWCSKTFDSLKASRPEPLPALGDRQNEIAAPLLAIADAAAGDWPRRARTALLEIFQNDSVREESFRVRLLRDIRAAFDESMSQQIPTSALLDHLNADENAPWCEFTHGKPLTARGLARMLAPVGVQPEHFREGAKTIRGYTRGSLRDVWGRYCVSPPVAAGTAGTSGTSNVLNELAVPDETALSNVSGTDEVSGTGISLKTKYVPDVTDVPLHQGQPEESSNGD
jgi:hypothetical protein